LNNIRMGKLPRRSRCRWAIMTRPFSRITKSLQAFTFSPDGSIQNANTGSIRHANANAAGACRCPGLMPVRHSETTW
jgi:hypothetical protein